MTLFGTNWTAARPAKVVNMTRHFPNIPFPHQFSLAGFVSCYYYYYYVGCGRFPFSIVFFLPRWPVDCSISTRYITTIIIFHPVHLPSSSFQRDFPFVIQILSAAIKNFIWLFFLIGIFQGSFRNWVDWFSLKLKFYLNNFLKPI